MLVGYWSQRRVSALNVLPIDSFKKRMRFQFSKTINAESIFRVKNLILKYVSTILRRSFLQVLAKRSDLIRKKESCTNLPEFFSKSPLQRVKSVLEMQVCIRESSGTWCTRWYFWTATGRKAVDRSYSPRPKYRPYYVIQLVIDHRGFLYRVARHQILNFQ